MISYKPLFHLLVERNMSKTELQKEVGFSSSTLAKISKNECVSLNIIIDICKFLNCKIEDVIEVII